MPGINGKKRQKFNEKETKMPRLPRVQIEGALYYVTCEGNQRGRIFVTEEDHRSFMGILAKYKEQYKFRMYAYALLPDHFHLLVELPGQEKETTPAISEVMRDINSSYTKYFNRVHSRTGHLFKQRYRSALVEKEGYLFPAIVYTHQNPKRIKIVTSPTEYPYTSCTMYSGGLDFSNGLMQKEKEEVENLLAGKGYTQAAGELLSAGNLNLHKRLQKRGMLGSKGFEDMVKKEMEEVSGAPRDEEKDPKAPGKRKNPVKIAVFVAGLILVYAVFRIFSPGTREEAPKNPAFVEYSLPEQLQNIMKRLEGSEWQIRMVPVTGGKVQMDTIEFYDGVFSSDNLVFRGFFPVEYSLLVNDTGEVVYTAKMKRGEDMASWYGEVSDSGEMRGTLTLRQKGLENRDFSFVSVSYSGKDVWRKLIEPKIRQ